MLKNMKILTNTNSDSKNFNIRLLSAPKYYKQKGASRKSHYFYRIKIKYFRKKNYIIFQYFFFLILGTYFDNTTFLKNKKNFNFNDKCNN